jgi:antitoxin (DNA-binding transcriptional repressor) of toxin-antitoxin stability system
MTTITTHQAKTHLSRYLAAVERGEEFLIARGKTIVAKLVPTVAEKPARPKVGDILGEPFEFPPEAFAPLTEDELREWGL